MAPVAGLFGVAEDAEEGVCVPGANLSQHEPDSAEERKQHQVLDQ